MSAIIQMPAPTIELVEHPKPMLAYIRQSGWVIVVQHSYITPDRKEWFVRPGGKRVMEYDILAWADLPPVPETAA